MQRATYRILAIDDDTADQNLLRRHLSRIESWDAEVVTCPNSEVALDRLRERTFDVILLDHYLGSETGLVVLDFLVASSLSRFQPVIMITGQGDEILAVEAIKSGAVDYIPKAHLSPGALQYAIENAVTKAAMRKELEHQREELERLARTDELTGLLNRRAFEEELRRECFRAKRFGTQLSLVMLDLDHFKQINDRYGHLMGDDVLRQTGKTIRDTTRNIDAAARWGGEEFCMLLCGGSPDGASIYSERLRKQLEENVYHPPDSDMFHVTCSIGFAHFDPERNEPSALVEAADQGLYRAKRAGRNQVSS